MIDKCILITGATSGIGEATAIGLAKLGYSHLILPVRDLKKGDLIKEKIKNINTDVVVDIQECDLASLDSIKHFANYVKENYSKLEVIINNAGVWQSKHVLSKDGIELTFAVNNLAPFLLTNLLLDLIKKSAPSRIINVSSALYKNGEINFDDIESKKSFNSLKVYSKSKLGNIFFTKVLAQRLKGTNVTVNALHPGVIATNLTRNYGPIISGLSKLVFSSPEKGAQTSLYLATSNEVSDITGVYFAKSKQEQTIGSSNDMDKAERFWNICEGYLKKYL